MRKELFAEGEFYHIYNRGTDKREIFSDNYDMQRFFESVHEFNVLDPIGSIYENSFLKEEKKSRKQSQKKLVEFIAYCLNKNHYHFIIQQVAENGIEKFMQRFGTGYTKYFNHKHKRSGSLFQGTFKARHIDSNEYLLHLSVYVNLNNRVHQLGSLASKSSWGEYTDKERGFCQKGIVLGQFRNPKEYKNFAESSLKDILARKDLYRELEAMLFDD